MEVANQNFKVRQPMLPWATFSCCLCAILLMSGCGLLDRLLSPEDSLNNNTIDTAFLLSPDVSMRGRAIMGKPDYFAFKAEAGRTIFVRAQSPSGGSIFCTAFRVYGPDKEVLYQEDDEKDPYGGKSCSSSNREKPPVKTEGVTFKELASGFELHVSARKAGTYFLSMHEQRLAEVEHTSWDYRITVTIE